MQTIKNILKITPAGAVLSDEYGSTSGIALEIMLGTEVRLVFELHRDSTADGNELPDYPLQEITANSYYCAIDRDNHYTDAPLLLQCDGITLTCDENNRTLFAVPIPNTAVEKLCQAMAGKSAAPMRCEIGGFNSNGTAVFAWQFDITVRNRVYGGGGEAPAAGMPDYYTAAQVEAVVGRELIFEFSSDGTLWHLECSADDQFLRLRHGINGTPSHPMPLPPRLTDIPWLPSAVTDTASTAPELAAAAHTFYTFSAPLTALTVTAVAVSLLETVIRFTTADTGFTANFPDSLNWVGTPEFDAGKTYIVSIVNNIAVAAEVTV